MRETFAKILTYARRIHLVCGSTIGNRREEPTKHRDQARKNKRIKENYDRKYKVKEIEAPVHRFLRKSLLEKIKMKHEIIANMIEKKGNYNNIIIML